MVKKTRKDKKLVEDSLSSLSPRQKLEAIKLAQVSKMAAARYLAIVLEKNSNNRMLSKSQPTQKSLNPSSSQEGDSLRIF